MRFNSLSDIVSYVETAVGEMAYDKYYQKEPEVAAKIRQARRRGVTDVGGWLADELYNDAELVNGLVGDQLYDYIQGLGEDPLDSAVWAKHIADLQPYIAHVVLK